MLIAYYSQLPWAYKPGIEKKLKTHKYLLFVIKMVNSTLPRLFFVVLFLGFSRHINAKSQIFKCVT